MSIDDLVRPDRLGAVVAEATGDERWRSLAAALIAGGKSNLTFQLTSEAGALILRRPPSGDLLPSAHDMGREARIQRALAGTPVPVARVVLHEPMGDLLGVPFYVMEKVAGHIIRDRLPEGYAETDREKVALVDALVDVLADLHSVDPEAVGLGDYGRPAGFLERQIRRWTGQWERSKTREVKAVDALGRLLARRMPAGGRSSIVHGDYRLDNCLMDLGDPSRVSAVLDWELSALGDPLTDLGLLLFYWREAGEKPQPLIPAVSRTPGFPGRAHLVERYAARMDVPLGDVAFYEAFAHFKYAVIAQGIAARVAAGAMAGQDFGDLGGEVRRIAESGLARLGQEG
ncbi:phosphotransferase family protein [Sphaerisporangium perillae]|uniref:phosphotransferase family protein n=1 Tax=Sphaerisporangium perillae TaxID=2935860 RepID=UPI00200DCE9D|nr:phosphotransferase family protein [Sphaerisporangium perillae]